MLAVQRDWTVICVLGQLPKLNQIELGRRREKESVQITIQMVTKGFQSSYH